MLWSAAIAARRKRGLAGAMALAAVLAAGTAAVAGPRAPAPAPRETVYIGTQGEVLLAGSLDSATGEFTLTGTAATITRPTWLGIDAARNQLFAVSELGNFDTQQGFAASFAIDPATAALTPISKVPSGAGGPTFLAADRRDHALFVAHYHGGMVAVLPLAGDGTLGAPVSRVVDTGTGPNAVKQPFAHAHQTVLAPGGRFVVVPDMGADRVFVWRFDRRGRQLSPGMTPFWQAEPGTGPRHIAFGRDGRFAYLVTELSAELRVLRWDGRRGRLTQLQALAMDPPGALGKEEASAAEVAISGDGRFLYASDRTRSTIEVFAINRATGRLRQLQDIASGGVYPRSFAIDATGRWLVVGNQRSKQVQVFAIDRARGVLRPRGGPVAVPEMPVSFAFYAR